MIEALRIACSIPLALFELVVERVFFDHDAELAQIKRDFLDLHEGE